MLNHTQYGERDADGRVVRLPENSAITGRPLEPGDVTVRLATGHLVGVKAREWRATRPNERQALRQTWQAQLAAVAAATAQVLAGPDYDSKTNAQLDALALERGVDMTGAARKEDKIARLRSADVGERFASDTVELPQGEGA